MGHRGVARLWLIVMLVGISLLPALSLRAQGPGLTETFNDPALPGWDHSPGVTASGGVPRIEPGNHAFHGGDWGDLALTVRVRVLGGEGALVVGYRAGGASAYYVLVEPGRLALQREANGTVAELGGVLMEVPIEGWFRLDVTAAGGEHTLALDGSTVLTATDPDPLPPGGVGFETLEGATAEVDELTVTVSGEAPPPAEVTVDPLEATAAPGAPAYQALPWVYTGGPIGGLGYDVRMRPDDPDVMFVTDAWAGVFKSVNGGETWFPTNSGITTRVGPSGDGIPVFSLTIDPNEPDRVWIGTQFSNSVFRSDDGGETWVGMNNGIEERAPTIRGFTVEPGNSDVVYLAGEVSSWEWSGEPLPGLGLDMVKGIVYKTLDGGQNWTRIWYGDNLARYVWIHPEDHDLVYVSTGIFDREAANSDAAAREPGGVGILRSRDGGGTWEVLDEANRLNADELYFGSLFMHPENPNVLLAAAGNDPYSWHVGRRLGGVYLTEDGGDTWTEVLDGHDFSVVEFCEGDPSVAYASAASGFFRSGDGGHTWQELGGDLWGPPGVVAGFPIDAQCDPRDADRVFVNNYGGGNFLSEDGGKSWRVASTGYTGALMAQVAVAQDDPAHVYASARSGIFTSHDGGGTWEGLSYGVARVMEGVVVEVDPRDSRHILATLIDGGPGPKVSRDGGKTWRDVDTGLWGPGRPPPLGAMVLRIAFSPSDPRVVFAGAGNHECTRELVLAATGGCVKGAGRGVIVSRDSGETWVKTGLSTGHVVALSVSPRDGSRVYAAVYDRSVYRSDDGGETWELVNQNPLAGFERPPADPDSPRPALWTLAVDPADPARVYAGFFAGGVAVSRDGGVTWEASSAGMVPEASVRAIVPDPANPDVVYAGALDSGVYVSQDGGQTWRAINDGLATRAVKDLSLSADGSVLYAATEGGGVFRLGTPARAPGQEPTLPAPTASAPAATPEPPGGGGGICGAAALPLALAGLVRWRKTGERRKRCSKRS